MTLEQRLTGLAFRVHIGHKGEFVGRDKELQRSKNNSRTRGTRHSSCPGKCAPRVICATASSSRFVCGSAFGGSLPATNGINLGPQERIRARAELSAGRIRKH